MCSSDLIVVGLNFFWTFCCNGLFCNFEHFCFGMCFVTDCQMMSLLGSKKLGTNVLELQYEYVGKL